MARDAAETRARILDAAHKMFFQRGFARVTMSGIAKSAKLTKRTLYHHFDSKDALLEAMLQQQFELTVETFNRSFAVSGTNAEATVNRLFDDLMIWSGRKDFVGSGFTRLAAELGDLPGHPAMRMARKHKMTIEAQFTEHLAKCDVAQPEELARRILILIEGAMTLTHLHRDPAYVSAAARAALVLLKSWPSDEPSELDGDSSP